MSTAGKRKLITSVAAMLIANGAVTTFSALFSNDKLEDGVEIYSDEDGVEIYSDEDGVVSGEDGPYVPEGLPIDKDGSPIGFTDKNRCTIYRGRKQR